jgi:hypothetical protein
MSDVRTDKQYLLDLLVDGELNEANRRDLLAWCERESDGWRRCALAFLEAQSWSKVLGDLRETSKLAADAPRQADGETVENGKSGAIDRKLSPAVSPQSFWNVRQWGTMLAMAASVALAFMLGLWSRDAAKQGRLTPFAGPAVNEVTRGGDKNMPADRRSGRPEQGPTGSSRLAVGGRSGAADEIHLPVTGDELDGDWLSGQSAAMPDDVRQALERMGHRVEQQRQLVPYRLGDGRRVLVPVDEVQIRPVENRNYQ